MTAAALWTAAEAAEATGGRATGAWRAGGVSIDSRSAAPGDLFAAIAGPNADGHDYAGAALAGGAAAAMVHHRPADLPDGAPLLEVADTLTALAALGARARARAEAGARIAAVTGSAGKTGTKEALLHALGGQAAAFGSPASYNNHWGAPLSLARMPPSTRYGVFEIGMNHAGEISPLSRLVRPHVAVVTNVEAAHIGFFESVERIADAKAEIFDGLEPGGVCVLNRDNRFFDRLRDAARARRPEARIVGFGTREADYRAVDVALDAEGSDVTADLDGRRIAYRIACPGRHWVLNSLAVLAAADALGVDVADCAESLAALPALAGRGRRHVVRRGAGTFTLIDESYNANPASMRAAIETLGGTPPARGGRRIAVLGAMRELGAESDALHSGLAGPLIENRIDLVLAAGRMGRVLDALPARMRGGRAETGAEMPALAEAAVAAGDVVMVKGSHASGMGAVVERLLSKCGKAGGRDVL